MTNYFYRITGTYKNGDSYDSGNLNLFQLSEHLNDLTDNQGGQLFTLIKNSDHPILESLEIQSYKEEI